jgi:hypothetical protein
MLLAVLLIVPGATVLAEQSFPTREAAVESLLAAVESQNGDQLVSILGEEYAGFQKGQSTDPDLAAHRAQRFAAALREFQSFRDLGEDRYILVVGAQAWPFPIPIVKSDDQWHFDGAAGVDELRNRIVGANELNAIALLDVYAAGQREYALEDHDGDGVIEFAARIRSTPGTRDGLYWDPEDGGELLSSPLDLMAELAGALFHGREQGSPFLGYYFRVLSSQGSHAKAGAFDYQINGHQLGGFALLAWPAQYGETGVMSFIVNQDHVIYERDLGPETGDLVKSITAFDPDETWTEVEDDSLGITAYTE